MAAHNGLSGNLKADELAMETYLDSLSVECERVVALRSWYILLRDSWASRELGAELILCAIASSFWPKSDRKGSSEFFVLSKAILYLVVGVLTGPCPIDVFAIRLRILPNCRSCMKKHEVETYQHFLLNCPAFARS